MSQSVLDVHFLCFGYEFLLLDDCQKYITGSRRSEREGKVGFLICCANICTPARICIPCSGC